MFRKDRKQATIINGYRFGGLFKASNHNSTLPETYLLTIASTCIEKQNFCHQLQQQKQVVLLHVQLRLSTFSLSYASELAA